MTALKALTASTALAWVNVATTTLFSRFEVVVIGPDTAMAGSATAVVADAVPPAETTRSALGPLLTTAPVTVAELLAPLGSLLLLLTDAVSLKAAPLDRPVGAKTTRVKVSVLPPATPAADSVTLAPL